MYYLINLWLLIYYLIIELDFYKTITLINFVRERSAHCTCMGCATSFDTLDAMVTHMKDNNCFGKLPNNDSDIWKDPK
jgi:predicted dithiol-disulfide oxidoreductase (DUF899 family)